MTARVMKTVGPAINDIPCRSTDSYDDLTFIEEGTYGRVFSAHDVETRRVYALKQVKFEGKSSRSQGFPVTALREISTLFSLSHPNIVHFREVVVSPSKENFFLVMEYVPHDLSTLLNRMNRPYSASEIKSLVQQILRALAHLHHHWVLHRDLKPSNLLLTPQGVVKICDFGLARYYADQVSSNTPGLATLWYRAPEILFGSTTYSTPVDVWAVGCIFAELLLMKPLIDGRGELEQISKMAKLLGAPSEQRWKGFSELPISSRVSFRNAPKESSLAETLQQSIANVISNHTEDIITRMLEYDPQDRISAADALNHPYFLESPAPKNPSAI